jgi:Tfp pilus assembly protein PilF
VPHQLPLPPGAFVGRTGELDILNASAGLVLRTGTEPASQTVMISAIGGAGGIGKTSLVLHWAHRNAHRFPAGQLFVDLRGFSPDSNPLDPQIAVRGFLVALGVESGRIPADLDAQTALYRSLVADKRMLIVLDNAATTYQVEPLLPGTTTCTVVVTSRKKLVSLITRYGARHLQLDILTRDEAHVLLTERLGQARVTAQLDAADELIRLCGRYPLALAIMARHAHIRPNIPLVEFATELRDLGLDTLDHDDDPAASLPTVLSWSLRSLTTQQRTVFALLGIAPGPDIGRPAVVSLTGLSQRHASSVLDALEEASLLARQPGSRYTMHDLIRDYAATTALHDLTNGVREAALRRVLDFYTHTAYTADHLLHPHRVPAPFDPPTAGVHPHPLPDTAAALAWFDTEHAGLLAAQHTATTLAWHSTVWHLAWALNTFHHWRGHRHDRLTMCQAAAEAATHLPDPTTRILAHRLLGRAHTELDHHEDALGHLHQALTLAEHHHNPTQQAHTHHALAWAWERRGIDRQALDHARHALDLNRSLNQSEWEADALNVVGWCAARLGDYDTARAHCQAALTLHRHHHDPDGEADALDSLGYIDHHSGHHTQAVDHYHHALTLRRDIGNTYEVAGTLDRLGHPHIALGQHEPARAVWQKALQLYREQGRDHDAGRVQRQLDALDHPDALQTSGPTESAN